MLRSLQIEHRAHTIRGKTHLRWTDKETQAQELGSAFQEWVNILGQWLPRSSDCNSASEESYSSFSISAPPASSTSSQSASLSASWKESDSSERMFREWTWVYRQRWRKWCSISLLSCCVSLLSTVWVWSCIVFLWTREGWCKKLKTSRVVLGKLETMLSQWPTLVTITR